jgi:hypothetical protein
MANMITPQCWIQGNHPDHIFPVKIDQTETVGSLKEAIKDKKRHAFQNVDTDKLDLWKVSIPLDDNLHESLHNLELAEGESLSGWEELLEVFPRGAPRRHIHIILKSPARELATTATPLWRKNEEGKTVCDA